MRLPTAVFRIAALAVGLSAAACLVGCGNGVEVGGPSTESSPSVVSPSPDQPSSAQPTAGQTNGSGSKTAPSQTASPSATKTHGSGSGATDHTTGGSGSNGSNGGSNSGTSGPPTGSSRPGQRHHGIAECGLRDLNVGLRTPAGGAAAGSQYVLISFTNSSPKACTIYGYPGVSFVGFHNGTQLGKPAIREHANNPHQVRLAPGTTKSALVQIAEAGNFPPARCQPTTSDGFRVYPPDSYTAAYVPFKTEACQSKQVAQLTVYPVGVNS